MRIVKAKNYPTFNEIEEKYEKSRLHHHLRLICVKCGKEVTCRCSAPKTKEYGICSECEDKDEPDAETKQIKENEKYWDIANEKSISNRSQQTVTPIENQRFVR